ncbi:afadin isoform X1 [Oncorhynchus mykiss]|uniref:afadin isoform X1 n=1 Tax=Oncorhynchus mykiss TaxID=8022 RepID=UPI0018785D6F|nr:afadin isoform X1 [Oncorhynchus mykiss]
MAGKEEWQRLADIIQHWNNTRLDLFEISLPCKNLEFHGVMRFYFEDHVAGNVATKCLRISSTTTTGEVIETLSEKFRPDMKMLNTPYFLFEVHANKEERQLDLSEKPLVVQLNWNTHNREGRFVLKKDKDIIVHDNSPEKKKGGMIQNFKRTLSRKEKKKEKKKTGDDAVNHSAKPNGSTMRKENGQISASVPVEKSWTNKDIVSNPDTTECKKSSTWRGMVRKHNQQQDYRTRNERDQDNMDQLALPVGIKFRENSEDPFLSAVINYTNSSTVHFKLSPAYVLYMAGRFVLHRHYSHSQETSQSHRPSEHAHRVTATVNKMVAMTEVVIQKQKSIAGAVAFWMANASELLNFLKQDRDLSPITLQAQENLAHLVYKAFKCLTQCLLADLSRHLPEFLIYPEGSQSPAGIEGVLQTLMGAMSLLRRCRVNAALTIQLFSQLFHSISAWLFNRLLSPSPQGEACSLGLRSHYWGATIRQRLSLVEDWAERQGLELAADCHLSRIIQVTMLLTMNKYSMQDSENIQNTCFKLNSLQLRTLMTSYLYDTNEPRIAPGVIDRVVAAAEASADEMLRNEGQDLQLEEGPDLHLPFLLPEEGYSCDTVNGIPQGFREFLEPICRKGLCTLMSHPQSGGTWTIFFNRANSFFAQDANPPLHRELEVVTITLTKPLNSGMGVSIVAAKGAGQDNLGIYVKSIVKGGPAEMDCRLTVGDQLLCVDGHSLVGLSQERAAGIMMHTGPVVTLQVAKQGATCHGLAALLDEPPSVSTTALDGSGPTSSSHAKLNCKAPIVYDGMEQSSGPSGLWGNNSHGGNRRQREQTLLKNRQLYRSNPNMISPEGEPVDPAILTDSKITAVSTSNLLCSDMYQREYLTLPAPRSQDKKTVAFELPPQEPRVSFNLDGQISNKRTLMRQALSQENLCMENDRPLVDNIHNAWNQNQQESYYTSFPMKPSISTHDIHYNHTVSLSTKTQPSRHNTGYGYWRTPTSHDPSSAIQPIHIDIPATRLSNTQPRSPMTTFQQTPTLLPVKLNQNPEGKGQGQALLSNQKQGSHYQLPAQHRQATCPPPSSVSMRQPQPSLSSSQKIQQQQASRRVQTATSQLFPTQSKDTSLQRPPAKPQPGTTPGHQDQYFSMNKEPPSEGNTSLSPDPWKRDAREKQQKQQRLQVVDLLEQEIQDLQAKAQLTPEETDRLRRLNLEWQFQQRLQEFQQNGNDDDDEDDDEEEDRDTSTGENVQESNGLNVNFDEKCSKEGQEENNFKGDATPENLTFKERQRLFSLGSNASIKVKAL